MKKDSEDKIIQVCSFGSRSKKLSLSKEEQDKILDFMKHIETEEKSKKKHQ